MELLDGVTDGKAKPPRAFVAVGILLICPQIINLEWVQCDIAVFDTDIKPGIHIVYDCDSRQANPTSQSIPCSGWLRHSLTSKSLFL